MGGLVLIAAALGLSNFAAAVGLGLAGISRSLRVRLGLIFGFFEAAMPLVGILVGHQLARAMGASAPYVGGGVLIATGVVELVRARRYPRALVPEGHSLSRLVLLGAALSIDNLIVGFALGAHRVNLIAAVITIGVTSVTMSLVGLELGDRLRASTEQWSDVAGAVVLIAVGVAIAAHLV